MFFSFCICQFFLPVYGSAETQAVRPSHASLVPNKGSVSEAEKNEICRQFIAAYANGEILAQNSRCVPEADYDAANAYWDWKLSIGSKYFPLSDADFRCALLALNPLRAEPLPASFVRKFICQVKNFSLPDVDLRLALLAQLEIFANQQVPESSVQDYIRRFTEWAESIKDLGEKQLPEWKGKQEGLAWRPAVPHTQQKMPGYFSRFYAWWKKPEEKQAEKSSAPDQNPCYFITGATPPTPNEQRVIADLALLTLVVQVEHARAQKDYAQFEALLGTVRQYLKERPRAATMGMLRPWVEALQQQKHLWLPTLTEVEERIRFPQVDAIKQNTLSAIKATGYAAGGIVLTCVLACHQASIYEYLYTIALSAWGAGSTPMMPPQVPAPPPTLPPVLSPAGHLRRHLATEAVDVLGLATLAMQNSSAALLALVAASGSTPCDQRALWLRKIFGHVDTQGTWVACLVDFLATNRTEKGSCQELLTGTEEYAATYGQCTPKLDGSSLNDCTTQVVFAPNGWIGAIPGPCDFDASTTPVPTTPTPPVITEKPSTPQPTNAPSPSPKKHTKTISFSEELSRSESATDERTESASIQPYTRTVSPSRTKFICQMPGWFNTALANLTAASGGGNQSCVCIDPAANYTASGLVTSSFNTVTAAYQYLGVIGDIPPAWDVLYTTINGLSAASLTALQTLISNNIAASQITRKFNEDILSAIEHVNCARSQEVSQTIYNQYTLVDLCLKFLSCSNYADCRDLTYGAKGSCTFQTSANSQTISTLSDFTQYVMVANFFKQLSLQQLIANSTDAPFVIFLYNVTQMWFNAQSRSTSDCGSCAISIPNRLKSVGYLFSMPRQFWFENYIGGAFSSITPHP